MKNALKFLAAVLVLGGAQSALATPMEFTAVLSGANESPPNGSLGTGFADVFLDPIAKTLQINVSYSGLSSNSTAAHIHCCTAVPLTGTAGVSTPAPAWAGFPLGVTAGTFNSPVFDLTLSSSYLPGFITAHGGTAASASADFIAGMLASETYLNIHTVNVGGGEIRGFLVFVPEPMTLSVFGVGLAGAAVLRKRRKAKA